MEEHSRDEEFARLYRNIRMGNVAGCAAVIGLVGLCGGGLQWLSTREIPDDTPWSQTYDAGHYEYVFECTHGEWKRDGCIAREHLTRVIYHVSQHDPAYTSPVMWIEKDGSCYTDYGTCLPLEGADEERLWSLYTVHQSLDAYVEQVQERKVGEHK